ncbi:hypothetical protein FJ955_03845 [Mesorhizobium sp. B2-2-2]|uniref:hypothetical protein n=1 Tax=Mesorhizobium sp. B2-2-2 TaxID=2589964 RepID=UPI00112A7E83|nr:hypothetical protein [Mesorhizobium sp. B2-2-2]TPM33877.1 hypothetical protein FJ955_03845 [Mesorhizobium sp. B2-2-2]
MAHEPKKAAGLSQPLTAAPMPEYVYQPYQPSRERIEDEKERRETADRKLDLSGVVLNLS